MLKKRFSKNTSSAETIIGPSVKVKGDFRTQGDIVIEGIVEGNIKTANNLFIGKKAKVKADIEVKDAKIGGLVKGKIKAKGFLELTATAKILGDVEAESVSIERGAIINGKYAIAANEEAALNQKDKEKSDKN